MALGWLFIMPVAEQGCNSLRCPQHYEKTCTICRRYQEPSQGEW